MRLTPFLLITLFLAASGCGSLPDSLRGDFSASPSLGAVQTWSDDGLRGRQVRWGGQIVRVQNRATETWVEVVAQPLHSDARPTGQSEGRFFAVFPGFLDPAAHGPGRELTVVGHIEDVVQENIGEYPYRFPVVTVTSYHFWPTYRPASEPRYWRDPWYDPWYPFLYPPWYWP